MATNQMLINIGIRGAKGAIKALGGINRGLLVAGATASRTALQFAKMGGVFA